MRNGVGTRPAVLGKALKLRYYRGAGAGGLPYTEVDVDCNSSPAAGRIVSLVKSYAHMAHAHAHLTT